MMRNKPSQIKMYYHPWKNRNRGKNTTGPHHTQKSSGIRKGRLPPISRCFKARPSGARSLSTETSTRQRQALGTRRDPGSPTPSPTSAGRKLAPRKCQGQAEAGARGSGARQVGAALSGGGACARPRLSRLRPRAMARARRAPALALGGPSQGCPERAPPCPHAVAAPSVRGAAAARPGGTWLPASQAGL